MSPPQLPGDVPVVDVLEPADRLAAPGVGVDGDLLSLERPYGGLRALAHGEPPPLGGAGRGLGTAPGALAHPGGGGSKPPPPARPVPPLPAGGPRPLTSG